jgi:hypothetical protein
MTAMDESAFGRPDEPHETSASPTAHPIAGRPWIASLIWVTAALYIPFVTMAIYTQAFVACPHCKDTTLQLAPIGPGLIATMLVIRHGPNTRDFWIAGVASACFVVAAGAVVKATGRWSPIILLPVFVVASAGAVILLALIRS